MKKLTAQATITSFINNGKGKHSLIQFVTTFIKNTNKVHFDREKIEDIQTAIAEAIENVITFAYPNKEGKIFISVSIYNNKILQVKIQDYGCGIENVDEALTPLFSTRENLAGLGFTVMESFSDKLTVKSTVGKGTIVTMKFYV